MDGEELKRHCGHGSYFGSGYGDGYGSDYGDGGDDKRLPQPENDGK